MRPYGMKKQIHKCHPHNECSVCAAQPPISKAIGRAEGKKIVERELDEFFDDRICSLPEDAKEHFDSIIT